jgi:hypothetical protein
MKTEPDQIIYKHDAFISYSSEDEKFAEKLEQALENYWPVRGLKLPQRYLDIFRDKRDFTAGDYAKNLEKHLMASAKLILLCSPNARKSQYVNDEIKRFVQMRGTDHIIPLLVSGIPNNEAKSDSEENMAFPEALCEAMQMPLAINYLGFDAKKNKVNKGTFTDAWYSVLASTYDASRSEIEQREKKKRARRRTIAIAVLSGIVVLLSVSLGIAIISRDEAVEARIDAERQKEAAETARTAEQKEREKAQAKELEANFERDKAVKAQKLAEERRVEADSQRQIAKSREAEALAALDKANRNMAQAVGIQANRMIEEKRNACGQALMAAKFLA